MLLVKNLRIGLIFSLFDKMNSSAKLKNLALELT